MIPPIIKEYMAKDILEKIEITVTSLSLQRRFYELLTGNNDIDKYINEYGERTVKRLSKVNDPKEIAEEMSFLAKKAEVKNGRHKY